MFFIIIITLQHCACYGGLELCSFYKTLTHIILEPHSCAFWTFPKKIVVHLVTIKFFVILGQCLAVRGSQNLNVT